MARLKCVLWLLALVSVTVSASERLHLLPPVEYFGLADASAGAALNSNLFVAASDENNTLRVYRVDAPGLPVQQYDCNSFLQITGKSPEADIEGAACIKNRVFWITSHGRNRNARERPNRCRFFATDILHGAGDEVRLATVGKPYKTLLADLMHDQRLSRFELDQADDRAPKDAEGLNIEGLSATPEGHLLIGFRNPVPAGKALIVPLLNPDETISGQQARLGEPIELDLGGLGIRDMALYQQTYIIIAGSFHSGGKFKLYRWDGGPTVPTALKLDHLNKYNPEAIIIYPKQGLERFQLLSDDGERLNGGVAGKLIKDPARQRFRSLWVESVK